MFGSLQGRGFVRWLPQKMTWSRNEGHYQELTEERISVSYEGREDRKGWQTYRKMSGIKPPRKRRDLWFGGNWGVKLEWKKVVDRNWGIKIHLLKIKALLRSKCGARTQTSSISWLKWKRLPRGEQSGQNLECVTHVLGEWSGRSRHEQPWKSYNTSWNRRSRDSLGVDILTYLDFCFAFQSSQVQG